MSNQEKFSAQVDKAKVDAEIAKFVENGYDPRHLVVTVDGHVLFDPEAANYDAYLRVFHPDKAR
jgi:hypothetical protein